MDEEARRTKIARNEYLVKQMNKRIAQLTAEFALDEHVRPDESARFFCVCGDPECETRISMRLDEYERVRASPHQFIVVPGHEHPKLERIIEHHPSYVVVEKLPEYRQER